MIFAKRFRGLRAENDLTQAEVAKILGVSPTTVATWEQGRSKPGLDKTVAIANLFNVSVDYLLGLTDNKRPAEKYYYSGAELENRGLKAAEVLGNTDFIKFTQKMRAENITPELLERIMPIILEIKKNLPN